MFQLVVVLECALKLKAISSINAECMPTAEMKHGLIALIRTFGKDQEQPDRSPLGCWC